MRSLKFFLILSLILLFKLTEAQKTYAQLRSDCAGRTCKKVDKNNKMARDMCLHKCVNKECYIETYQDLDRITPRYTGSKTENDERARRKKVFVDCFNKKRENPVGESGHNEEL